MKLLVSPRVIGVRTWLLIILMLSGSRVTSLLHNKAIYMDVLADKRYDVVPRDVITRSSAIQCGAACRDTSWCVAANVHHTGERECQLLSEEASNATLLDTADGWKYIREYYFRKADFSH